MGLIKHSAMTLQVAEQALQLANNIENEIHNIGLQTNPMGVIGPIVLSSGYPDPSAINLIAVDINGGIIIEQGIEGLMQIGNIESGGSAQINISAGKGTINVGTSNETINIGTNNNETVTISAGAGMINIGTATETINIGTNNDEIISISAGTGTINIGSDSETINFGGSNNGTVNITTGSGSINIGTESETINIAQSGEGPVNIGAGGGGVNFYGTVDFNGALMASASTGYLYNSTPAAGGAGTSIECDGKIGTVSFTITNPILSGAVPTSFFINNMYAGTAGIVTMFIAGNESNTTSCIYIQSVAWVQSAGSVNGSITINVCNSGAGPSNGSSLAPLTLTFYFMSFN